LFGIEHVVHVKEIAPIAPISEQELVSLVFKEARTRSQSSNIRAAVECSTVRAHSMSIITLLRCAGPMLWKRSGAEIG
jgi:hypothetical protein